PQLIALVDRDVDLERLDRNHAVVDIGRAGSRNVEDLALEDQLRLAVLLIGGQVANTYEVEAHRHRVRGPDPDLGDRAGGARLGVPREARVERADVGTARRGVVEVVLIAGRAGVGGLVIEARAEERGGRRGPGRHDGQCPGDRCNRGDETCTWF